MVICPYCQGEAELVHSSEIYFNSDYDWFWLCRPCWAYVGTHKNSKRHAPLGTLANEELRTLRIKVHWLLDQLWKSGEMTRSQAYKKLGRHLRKDKFQMHVAKLNIEECVKSIAYLSSINGRRIKNDSPRTD